MSSVLFSKLMIHCSYNVVLNLNFSPQQLSPRKNSKSSSGPVSVNSIGNGSAAVTKVSSTKVNSSIGGNNNRGKLNKIVI